MYCGSAFGQMIPPFFVFPGPKPRERPVTQLNDSVSRHIDISVFTEAKFKGIELYRIVPNATHLMQPLDSREDQGRSINRENFTEKLTEAFLLFYKPLTVINAFKSSGIYPVDSSAISSETLKPALTFSSGSTRSAERHKCGESIPANETTTSEQSKAEGALEAVECVTATPIRWKYKDRVVE
ncbi:hypothetical protein MAR_034991, partial [Mya arenaria]